MDAAERLSVHVVSVDSVSQQAEEGPTRIPQQAKTLQPESGQAGPPLQCCLSTDMLVVLLPVLCQSY